VEKAQHGDTDSFAGLYDFFVNPIYRYVFFKVKKEDALDLTENIFLKVWEKIGSYHREEGKGTFSSWIYRIAHNTVVDYYRLEKEFTGLDENVADDKRQHDPIRMTEQKLSQETLKTAVSKLKKTYRQIILLKFIKRRSANGFSR